MLPEPQKRQRKQVTVEETTLHLPIRSIGAEVVSSEFARYYGSHIYAHAPMFHLPTLASPAFRRAMPDYLALAFNAFVAHFASRDVLYPCAPRPSPEYARQLLKQASESLIKNNATLSIEIVQAFGFISR